jgi:hypothetical protein
MLNRLSEAIKAREMDHHASELRMRKFNSELDRQVFDGILGYPGAQDLEIILKDVPEGERADYLLCDGKVIIEHKDYEDTEEHRQKAEAMNDFSMSLVTKYNIPQMDIARGGLRDFITDPERAHLDRLHDLLTRRIQNRMQGANGQIGSTKRLLNIPDAIGVFLYTFDRVSWMVPAIPAQRFWRSFATEEQRSYNHLDVAIAVLRPSSTTVLNFHALRTPYTPAQEEVARHILGILRGVFPGAVRRMQLSDAIQAQAVEGVTMGAKK